MDSLQTIPRTESKRNRRGGDPAKVEYVAIMTFSDEYGGMFYEAGGVYDHKPYCKGQTGDREFVPGEHLALCPRCGAKFAGTDDGTAESHRDLHFDGDEDIPSICRNLPPRRSGLLTCVGSGGAA